MGLDPEENPAYFFFSPCALSLRLGGKKFAVHFRLSVILKAQHFLLFYLFTLMAKHTILAGVGGQSWGPLFLLLGTSGCCLAGIYLHTVLKDISVFSLAMAERKHLDILPLQLWVLL